MKKNPEWPKCSSCGWDESAEEEQPNHLARHSTLLGKYYIGRVLGQGGFGITYLAFEKTMAIPVAIKEYFPGRECYRKADRRTVLPLSESHRWQFEYGLGSFLEEVRALAKLDGRPNIVSVKACEQANGTAYMVMAYIKGKDLKRHLASEGGRIPHSEAQEILMSVLSALSDVHRIGLVHRDISPDNIMISDEGIVKLIDFGAARYAVGEQSMSLTTILKPGYAPPEQYRTSDRQGPWTDVYAASATYYRCITGSIPPMALDRELKDEMAPPSTFCQDLPSERQNALLMALSVRAEDRFQSVEAFQRALIVEPIQPQIPPSLHWAVVFLASVFTAGAFGVGWAMVQALWIQKVYAQSRGAMFLAFSSVCYLITACTLVSAFLFPDYVADSRTEVISFSLLIGLMGITLGYIGLFDVRRSLVSYYNTVEPIGLWLSGGMTLVFGILYIQSHLTRIARSRQSQMVFA